MIRYNDAISGIIEKLEKMSYSLKSNTEAQQAINSIIKEIDSNTKQNIWDEFEKVFKNIHSVFYKKLLEICPDISASEIKIAALLKLNLSTKEIAAITYKSEGGIKTTRYRLRQKLNLSSDEKLVPFLMQL
jgi:DNA-binding CsgD family transcriptional regulator